MPAQPLPGIRQRTGLLIGRLRTNIAASGTAVFDQLSVDLGPGFAVGVHGVLHALADGDLSSDNDYYAAGLLLDPDESSFANNTLRPSQATAAHWDKDLDTNGATLITPQYFAFPEPILTVKNMQAAAIAGGPTSGSLLHLVYYAIYEVSDAEFLRIAGVSLSRS